MRTDNTVTGVEFNIQDSIAGNDDTLTGQVNGNGNDTNGAPIYAPAAPVSPNATVSASYPDYPQEFRFNYMGNPSSGAATIRVRLKEFATSVYTNRYTMLTSTVKTLAPTRVVQISNPATNGLILAYTNDSTYMVQACFSSSLTTATNNFNVLINRVLQPQTAYILQPVNGVAACPGFKSLTNSWNNPAIGTNLIQVIYTNAIPPISDTRLLTVAPLLRISYLANNNQLILWNSAPGVNYQVLATTNLTQPFQVISGIIPALGSTTSFYDANLTSQKFYEIQMVP